MNSAFERLHGKFGIWPFWSKACTNMSGPRGERCASKNCHNLNLKFLAWFLFLACFCFLFCFFFVSSLNYANALDVWSCLRHSVLLVVLLRYWVPLQWMHTTVHSTKSLPKGWKEFKALKRQKGLSWDFFYVHWKKRIKYKFPIGACYGSGSHIKALYYDIKAACFFFFFMHTICKEKLRII